MKKSSAFALVIVGLLFLIPLASAAGLLDWITGKGTSPQPTNVTVGVGNTAPIITYVEQPIAQTPSEEGTTQTTVTFAFGVYDHDNSTDLNDATAYASFNMSGVEALRDAACTPVSSLGKYRNYSCSITIQYYDLPGFWTITTKVNDSSDAEAVNSTLMLTINNLAAIKITPEVLLWGTLSPGALFQNATNHPTVINNTGNIASNISLKATDLAGNIDDALAIDANNFTISKDVNNQCLGPALDTGVYVDVNNSGGNTLTVNKGNLSLGGGVAQGNVYYCLQAVNGLLTKQVYSTTKNGAWNIKIDAQT